jgi:hypothetical protein
MISVSMEVREGTALSRATVMFCQNAFAKAVTDARVAVGAEGCSQ